MTGIDEVLPAPRRIEIDSVYLHAPIERVWDRVRHGDLATSPLVRALFAVRDVPRRLKGEAPEPFELRLDALGADGAPGFRLLVDRPCEELVVGAIGKVWMPEIPYVDVADAEGFRSFLDPGFVKVAWAVRVAPLSATLTRLVLELRVDATDAAAWEHFVTYFRFIGPASRFIRKTVLRELESELGPAWSSSELRPLPGDELLPHADAQLTQSITIGATPERIWPWLVQMGCGRGGFYAVDILDNGGVHSAREVHPELQGLGVGDAIAATPDGRRRFEVLRLEPAGTLVLGVAFDGGAQQEVPFSAPIPAEFWRSTWAFHLEPLGDSSTRLHVRARAAFSSSERLRAIWIQPVHAFMQHEQLQHLAERAEGRVARDDWRDVAGGMAGMGVAAAALLTPFHASARQHWGLAAEEAARSFPGDDLVPNPRWGWTHGVEIAAPAEAVWPWIAQIGAGKAGFYSYQWLENLAGCGIRNAETIHPEWAVERGGSLRLHPDIPPLPIVALEEGRYFVAHGRAAESRRVAGRPWVDVSWLFLVEPVTPSTCRFISRYRCATSLDFVTRARFGRALMEPIGFAMDRRMLLGVKQRAERALAVAR